MTNHSANAGLHIYVIGNHQLNLDPVPGNVEVSRIAPVYFDEANIEHARRVSRADFFAQYGREPINGELGCAMAHAEAYRAFLDTDSLWALVFEDDALISNPPALHARCNEVMRSLDPAEPYIVSFCHPTYPHGFIKHDGAATGLVVANAPPAYAVAYLMTRSAAQELARETKVIHRVADWPVQAPQVRFLLDTRCAVGERDPKVRPISTIDATGTARPAPPKSFDFQVWTFIWWMRHRASFAGIRSYWHRMIRPRFMLRWYPTSAESRL